MNQAEALQIFEKEEAGLTGHFVLKAGDHSDFYMNKDEVSIHVASIARLCDGLAAKFDPNDFDVVVGPATAGIIVAQWITHHLNRFSNHEILAVYGDKVVKSLGELLREKVEAFLGRFFARFRKNQKDEQIFEIRRGFGRHVQGKRALIVEDIVTTGSSVIAVKKAVEAVGGKVEGIAVLCNRGGVTHRHLGVAYFKALVTLQIEKWSEAECREKGLCRQGIPINTKVGHGKAYVQEHGQPTPKLRDAS